MRSACHSPEPAVEPFRTADLVEVVFLDLRIHLDGRIATTNSFLSTPRHSPARALPQPPAAKAVVRKIGQGARCVRLPLPPRKACR
jgi:D-alanyl-D-alanine dipeptidase